MSNGSGAALGAIVGAIALWNEAAEETSTPPDFAALAQMAATARG